MKGALKNGKNIKGPGYRTATFYRLLKNNLNAKNKKEKQAKFKIKRNAL